MEGPAVRSPGTGGVLDRFWPTPYPACPEEMSSAATSTTRSPAFTRSQEPRSIHTRPFGLWPPRPRWVQRRFQPLRIFSAVSFALFRVTSVFPNARRVLLSARATIVAPLRAWSPSLPKADGSWLIATLPNEPKTAPDRRKPLPRPDLRRPSLRLLILPRSSFLVPRSSLPRAP